MMWQHGEVLTQHSRIDTSMINLEEFTMPREVCEEQNTHTHTPQLRTRKVPHDVRAFRSREEEA